MKRNGKSIISLVLIVAMTLTMVFTFAGCSSGIDGKDGITPQLRINAETNYWEVSYDEGETWESMGVKATGESGKDGINGQDGKDGINGTNGKDGINGQDGKDGVDGAPGKDGADGKDGVDGAPGKDGQDGKDVSMEDIMRIIEDYETFKTVSLLIKDVSFGTCNLQGTDNCLSAVYLRPFVNDKSFYNGATRIATYLNGVFVEDANGVVTVSKTSALIRASYNSESLTVLNFALAFDGYEEYAMRNNVTLPEAIQKQKDLAIKYFNTVDYTSASYNEPQNRSGYTFCSQAVSDIALASLLGQAGTDRYDKLIKLAYDNLETGFWAANKYIDPFYQLCADYSWFDKTKLPTVGESLTDAAVLNLYGFGINLAKDYPNQWKAWVTDALSDNKLDASEAKAFTYHYAYQITGGKVDLGAYGNSRAIVDYNK